ncbi:phospholipid carrier-dependent glycosyltransferase [Candidatus Gottesmanbacteria bacterium]|nr:phospholipid carrier-dependent glycosyltransferase [Candidatus Gottesmanbacteria bacterium]
MQFNKRFIFFVAILFLAAYFRFFGVNWDQGQHLHPDERFLTMVTGAIQWPKNLFEYLDSASSPLNPHNRGFGFFVYGTFPIFFAKWFIDTFAKEDYGSITLIGRQLSAMIDLGTVFFVFLIAKQISSNDKVQLSKKVQSSNAKNISNDIKFWIFPLLSMFIYSITVLSIQISHFFAVDVYLTFFITLAFYLLLKIMNSSPKRDSLLSFWILNILLGVSYGLAIASKISAVVFFPIIGLGLIWLFRKNKNIVLFLFSCSLFTLFFYMTVRFAQPYLFATPSFLNLSLNNKILANWKELAHYWKPDSGFPPSIQWFYITPLLFPLRSLLLWGLGLPLGVLVIFGLVWGIGKFVVKFISYFKKNQKFKLIPFFDELLYANTSFPLFLIIIWSLGLFIYQGIQPAPSIRYFHPIYPFLSILTAYFICDILLKRTWYLRKRLLLIMLLLSIIWPVSFISIYSQPHSRVSASEWIYQNVPRGSTIANEHWDDGLPLSLDSSRIHEFYNSIEFPLYNPDSQEKWLKMVEIISKTDYISLSSNRLWASLTRVPDRYPLTDRYYRLLFNGELGFQKVAEVTSYPNISFPLLNYCLYILSPQEDPLGLASNKSGFIRLDTCDLYQQSNYRGIVIRDESAEETFTVYDHPKVLIFQNKNKLTAQQLLNLITSGK